MCLFARALLYPVNFSNVHLCVGTCVSGFHHLDLLCRKRCDFHRCFAGLSFDYMLLSPAATHTHTHTHTAHLSRYLCELQVIRRLHGSVLPSKSPCLEPGCIKSATLALSPSRGELSASVMKWRRPQFKASHAAR